MKKFAIIVAGGVGTRMKSDRPKQFLELNGKPILVQTIEQFLKIDFIEIVLVLPEEHVNEWDSIGKQYFTDHVIKVVHGGATRSDSVKAGLASIESDGLVAIHDAVRPFVTKDLIEASFKSAEEFGSGVAAIALKDSIRKIIEGKKSEARDRNNYVLVQTPQTFQIAEIKEAYKNVDSPHSDDATVYELQGYSVKLVEGDYSNIKITTPDDLK